MGVHKRLTARTALQLAAPHTWVASVYPALFGIVFGRISGCGISMLQGTLLIAVCILMQSAVNTLNDYADYVKGTDSMKDNVEKSDAVLLYNDIPPAQVMYLALVYLTAGAVLGIFSCVHAGFLPLCIGAIGCIVVLAYSGGRFPLSYLPVGEVVSGFVMGAIIPLGIVAAACNTLQPAVLLYSLPLTIGIALIMMTNNGCDIEKDARSGRHTLPICIGRKKTILLYRSAILVWIVLLCLLPFVRFGIGYGIMSSVCLLGAWRVLRTLFKSDLHPENRIRCMKAVVLTNLCGNGIYIAAAVIALIVKGS